MLDPKRLLEQMLGDNRKTDTHRKSAGDGSSHIGARAGDALHLARERLSGMGGVQSFAGGAVGGSLLGLLLGNRKMRKAGGGVLGYGGGAVLGALAHRAYQNYKEGRPVQTAPTTTPGKISDIPPAHLPLDLLAKPADPSRLAAEVTNPEQAGEVYLASRPAMDPDEPTERAYLDTLASQLRISNELRAHLERQLA
jgi:uncharacterized membrane protein YebE (DUF533 family)